MWFGKSAQGTGTPLHLTLRAGEEKELEGLDPPSWGLSSEGTRQALGGDRSPQLLTMFKQSAARPLLGVPWGWTEAEEQVRGPMEWTSLPLGQGNPYQHLSGRSKLTFPKNEVLFIMVCRARCGGQCIINDII